ncbi:hypothetical protein LSAT2_016522, partial [Lamellibrachia satsuma]
MPLPIYFSTVVFTMLSSFVCMFLCAVGCFSVHQCYWRRSVLLSVSRSIVYYIFRFELWPVERLDTMQYFLRSTEVGEVFCSLDDCNKGMVWIAHSANCHLYFVCERVYRNKFRMHGIDCGELFWNQYTLLCER